MGHYDEHYEEEAAQSRQRAIKESKLKLELLRDKIFNSDVPDFTKHVAYAFLVAKDKGLI